MVKSHKCLCALAVGILVVAEALHGQVDPVHRQLIQVGYSQPLQGLSPFPGYAFYYWNKPGFLRTNLTLRLAVAPVYLDSELGVSGVLGPNTDLGFALAGGGFADTYSEVRGGKYIREESFTGHGVEGGLNLYHRFNPQQRLPLYGIVGGAAHRAFFERDDRTDPAFEIPEDLQYLAVRAGLRLGGAEPLLLPELGFELSAWYEGQFRNETRPYGFNGDRHVERDIHRLWARAAFNYTFKSRQLLSLAITGGSSLDADRFGAYRLGSWLPFTSEFPLNLPGYFYQELSARNLVHANLQFVQPLGHSERWSLALMMATALVDYAPGVQQPGHWHSGLGGGLVYLPPSKAWQVIVGYGYGIDAIRHDDRGAHSISILVQFDFRKARTALLDPSEQPPRARGLHEVLRRIF